MTLDKKLLEHLFITVPTMFGVAYFVLWACAPPAALPPPVPMLAMPAAPLPQTNDPTIPPEQTVVPRLVTGELGVGAMGGIDLIEPEVGGWAWLSGSVETPYRLTNVGIVASAAYLAGEGAGSGGGYLRYMSKRPYDMLGVEISGGWLWARVAIPYMRQFEANRWFYVSPGATVSAISDVQLPFGVAVQTGRFGVVRMEAGVALRGPDTITPAAYFALSGSLRFGKDVPRPLNTQEVLDVAFPQEPRPQIAPTSAPSSSPSFSQPSSVPFFFP